MFKNPIHVKARNHILQSGMVVGAAQSSTEALRNLKTLVVIALVGCFLGALLQAIVSEKPFKTP